jgi:16S rRNA (cytosine1402-N4)-methyltransferase
MSDSGHAPVMLGEVVQALRIRRDGCYVDATFGRGGHSRAILAQLSQHGRLLAVDRDPDAVTAGQQLAAEDSRLTIIHAPFSDLARLIQERELAHRITGVVLDLGVSSPQFDTPSRGFSFRASGTLDMRMDPTRGETAASWLDGVDEAELTRVLREFGEERYARRVARAIIRSRPITSTSELAGIVEAVVPGREPGKHPATRTFQALRMVVNQELAELRAVLPQAADALAPGGRLVVISFHSLEDRLVKRFIRDAAKGDPFPPDLPVTGDRLRPTLKLVGKARRPEPAEISRNPRARSAVMRVAEKIQDGAF